MEHFTPNINPGPELTFFRGLPASGKSTEALKWVAADPENRVRVNRDDLRFARYNAYVLLDEKTGEMDKNKEGVITQDEEKLIRTHLKEGKKVVSDNTNLNMKHVLNLQKIAKQCGATIKHQDFPVSLEETLRRNAERERVVEPWVIERMYRNNFGPNGEFHLFPGSYPTRPFMPPVGRKMAVGFDMDGSLADTRSIQFHVEGKQRNFDAFHRGSLFVPPNPEVLKMAFRAHKAGFSVIITTARNEAYREVTQKWLDDYNVPYENIFMRADGDQRKDYVVKDEMLHTKILPHYDLIHSYDDNPQAVQAWRKNGIRVTVVPGFGKGIPEDVVLQVPDAFAGGKCVRCGKPLRNGDILGPKCAQLV